MGWAELGGYAVIIVSVIAGMAFHEAAHAFAAMRLGDRTAFERGRVTLNPLKHIDPLGTVALPAILFFTHAPFLFGYAKPVPVSWKKLGHPKRDMSLVALAGPVANLALAVLLMTVAAIIDQERSYAASRWMVAAFSLGATTNFVMGVFNLIPIPPLDGSKVIAGLIPDKFAIPYLRLGRFGFLPVLLLLIALPFMSIIIAAVRSMF